MKNNNQKFRVLLEQLSLPSLLDDDQFSSATIEKVVISKSKRQLFFIFRLKDLPNVVQWHQFHQALHNSFQNIAKVDYQLEIADQLNNEVKDQYVKTYWPFLLNEGLSLAPNLKKSILERDVVVNYPKIIIPALNDNEAALLMAKCQHDIVHSIEKLGLGKYHLIFEVNEITAQEKISQHEQAHHQFIEQETEKLKQTILENKSREQQDTQSKPYSINSGGYRGGRRTTHVTATQMGREIDRKKIQSIEHLIEPETDVVLEGYIFDMDVRTLRNKKHLITLKVTDYSDSIAVKFFNAPEQKNNLNELVDHLSKGQWVRVCGNLEPDYFTKEMTVMVKDLEIVNKPGKEDTADKDNKRVELHLHSNMSQLDGITSIKDYVAQAAKWGHKAIAITDHYNLQAYPDATHAAKKAGIKMIYGVEVALANDEVPIAYHANQQKLEDATYVVFDVETTGLSPENDKLIEIAAIKMHRGEIISKFESFINPNEPLSSFTIELTKIQDSDVQNAPQVEEVMTNFYNWVDEDDIYVAHNASFDMGFINTAYERLGFGKSKNGVIDTLQLSRTINTKVARHGLNYLAKYYQIPLTQHHRAIYDTETTSKILVKMLVQIEALGIHYHNELNDKLAQQDVYKRARPTHCTILVQNSIGLKNLFKIVSQSFTETYYRQPIVLKSTLNQYREGLLVGSACQNGELFETVLQQSEEEAQKIAQFYDYFEIQPKDQYANMLERELIKNEQQLEETMKKIIKLADKMDKPVVATGNTHYLYEHSAISRQILVASDKKNPLSRQILPPAHFRTTDEMLRNFSFLGEADAQRVVVTNSQKIADMIEEVNPLKDKLYTPKIEGAEDTVREMSYAMAKKIYGDNLPQLVIDRLEKELTSIIGNGFAVIYLISHKLVKKSLDDGYLVGSRGSVGSSFVATMMEITEVNPLPPHYICSSCGYADFDLTGQYGSGFDMPQRTCDKCQQEMIREGQDIPFETFLGFKGDKVPDIDLNFSGEYQPIAHAFTKEIFGEDYVYRAGTIGTIAEKTAFGYVKNYLEERNIYKRGAEIDRLVSGCTGVKRTTGQHPGGIIVIPDYMDVFDFTPIQYPADDLTAAWRTTHFDFHSIHDNVLKLDILGHDDPTMIRMLQDLTGIDPKDVPTSDPEVMQIFQSPNILGVKSSQIFSKTGTLGIPEFGTGFVRKMLEDTKPTTFSELVQISGLSHGTDVWLGNAQDLINSGICQLSDVIGCRDDIMVYLIYQGLDESLAFKIMESVRKGKGLTEDFEQAMKDKNVPEWYMESCKKIKYMFPKAHAAAYVLMAIRIAWFKVHRPLYYYAAYFTVRASDFDLLTMTKGAASLHAKLTDMNKNLDELKNKDKDLMTVLELANEMVQRGFAFQKISLEKSSANEFIIEGDSLIPPFNAIPGLGDSVAKRLVEARDEAPFLSKEELKKRGGVSDKIIDYLTEMGSLAGMPEKAQLSLFDDLEF